MLWLALGIALLAAVAIVAIGVMYLSNPRAVTRGFGLPLPEEGSNIAWWLRLKGSRDIVSGLVALAVMEWGGRVKSFIGIVGNAVIGRLAIGDPPLVESGLSFGHSAVGRPGSHLSNGASVREPVA